MIQHESIHHRMWSVYAALGKFETPRSLADRMEVVTTGTDVSLATPKRFEAARKHRRRRIDPRLKRWGITVVPVALPDR
jgi:hypothetical protein